MSYDLVPESAPFSAEQRSWLNGFLAGILGSLDAENATGGSGATLAAAALLPSLSGAAAPATETTEDFPWHDSSLPVADRMSLAEGKPLARRMMAAMAQLDCGSCGYLCKTYAEAIAIGKEKNLTLCTPGGSETAKLLRTLNKHHDKQHEGPNGLNSGTPATDAKAAESTVVGTRAKPATAQLISSERLNGALSAKDTRHVTIDLCGSGLRYRVGDALGVLPTNCEQLVRAVCQAAGVDPEANVRDGEVTRSLAETLLGRCLRSITSELCDRARERVQQRPKRNGDAAVDELLMKRLGAFVDADGFDELDVCDFLAEFGPLSLLAQDLADTLAPLRPRLYSIASSQSVHPNQVHLTVGRVENHVRGRARKGVASTMFADRLQAAASLQVFVQPNHGFTIPADPSAATIMIGPGTGIAPFIAFLQQREFERGQQSNCGENWLFFGDQTRQADFLYEQQLSAWLKSGLLSRLDLAFSRDGNEKVYVQHRMQQQGAELFRWLESGSHLYVCGDAQRMARDVEQALLEVIVAHGGYSSLAAKDYLKSMRQSHRYATDVY